MISIGENPGGGGVMTLHDYGYLPPEFLKTNKLKSMGGCQTVL